MPATDALSVTPADGASAQAERDAAFRALVAHASEMAYLFDPVTLHIFDPNQAFLTFLGHTAEAASDLTMYHFVASERTEFDQFVRELRDIGEVTGIEQIWRRKDGTPRTVRLNAGIVRHSARDIGFLMAHDVTTYMDAEGTLGKHEAIFRQLFAANPHPMWIYDTETLEFLEVNGAAVARYGYSREEFLRMRVTDIRPPQDVPTFLAKVEQTRLSGHRLSSHRRHQTKEGQLLDVDVASYPLDFAGRSARLVVAHDVTARVQAESALRASEARLLALHQASLTLAAQRDPRKVLEQTLQSAVTLLEAGSGTFYHWDANAGLLRCAYNWRVPEIDTTPDQRPGEGLAGHAFDHLAPLIVNDYLTWEHRMPSGVAAGLRAALAVPLIRSGTALGVAVVRAYDDAVRFTESDARLLGLFADQAAIALENAQLHADLERRVQDRTAELEAANRELEAFAYSVSHDLRAPLRWVDGFSQALLEDYGGQLDDVARDYLARIRLGSQRMGQLIDDLLALSRVSRRRLRVERVDLSALARAVADELRRADPDRPVTVSIAEGLVARADAGLLRVVLENLLGNAWKFTGREPDPRIEVGGASGDGPPVFHVRDNGVGFDMAYAHKLFGAFQRLHSESEFPGTGIGLATVQRIIHRHGGSIWAEGGVGRGVTFSFTLAAPHTGNAAGAVANGRGTR